MCTHAAPQAEQAQTPAPTIYGLAGPHHRARMDLAEREAKVTPASARRTNASSSASHCAYAGGARRRIATGTWASRVEQTCASRTRAIRADRASARRPNRVQKRIDTDSAVTGACGIRVGARRDAICTRAPGMLLCCGRLTKRGRTSRAGPKIKAGHPSVRVLVKRRYWGLGLSAKRCLEVHINRAKGPLRP